MSELQYRIWCDKLIMIDRFYKGDINFNTLVIALEPPMDAAPIKEENLIKGWYELWGPLEDLNAFNLSKGIETTSEMVMDRLEIFRKFIIDNMEEIKKL